MNLQIEYVDTDSVKEYENNAKRHPQEQIEQIKHSIQTYGFNDPVAIWNEIIVEGHGRVLAAKELGIKKIPVIRLNNLSDKERREYMLVHNQTTMNSGWDFEKLEAELDELDFDGFDFGFQATDFDETDLDDLFTDSEEKEKEPKKIQCPHCGEWFEE